MQQRTFTQVFIPRHIFRERHMTQGNGSPKLTSGAVSSGEVFYSDFTLLLTVNRIL
ncbi:hypothetical protein SAMN05443144_107184 [Fodinibius roseus]|uniref:Uncharacterized protein n=1 Tax=Fodinibius roseus TaxID=1194090 RepID=A0A1M5AVC1_9BACT|nr:hypothetical protein SAMN05443144_107184 [Fodinibius roseus]